MEASEFLNYIDKNRKRHEQDLNNFYKKYEKYDENFSDEEIDFSTMSIFKDKGKLESSKSKKIGYYRSLSKPEVVIKNIFDDGVSDAIALNSEDESYETEEELFYSFYDSAQNYTYYKKSQNQTSTKSDDFTMTTLMFSNITLANKLTKSKHKKRLSPINNNRPCERLDILPLDIFDASSSETEDETPIADIKFLFINKKSRRKKAAYIPDDIIEMASENESDLALCSTVCVDETLYDSDDIEF